MAGEALEGGRAAAVFGRMVAALGGPADLVEKPEKHLAKAPVELAVRADRAGFVSGVATRDIGLAVVTLGGGRRLPGDGIDPAVGLTRLLPVGSQVHEGEALALVHARTQADAEQAAATVLAAYSIGPSKPPARKTVLRRILPQAQA
jgi:thymidine phosphorylase